MQTESIKILRPDSKGRIALGKLASGISSFRVSVDAESRIVLEPFAEIPARERWLYQNKEALTMVLQGLEDSRAGRTVSLGDFSKYADDEIE